MKVIIAGSRTIVDYGIVCAAIEAAQYEITEIVSGGAIGVDTLGEEYALLHKIKLKRMPVTREEWEQYGRSAGMRRNAQMETYSEALIAVWDGKSRGTADMIKRMKRAGKLVSVYVHKE